MPSNDGTPPVAHDPLDEIRIKAGRLRDLVLQVHETLVEASGGDSTFVAWVSGRLESLTGEAKQLLRTLQQALVDEPPA